MAVVGTGAWVGVMETVISRIAVSGAVCMVLRMKPSTKRRRGHHAAEKEGVGASFWATGTL